MWQRGSRLVMGHGLEISGSWLYQTAPLRRFDCTDAVGWGNEREKASVLLLTAISPPYCKASTSETPLPIPRNRTVLSASHAGASKGWAMVVYAVQCSQQIASMLT